MEMSYTTLNKSRTLYQINFIMVSFEEVKISDWKQNDDNGSPSPADTVWVFDMCIVHVRLSIYDP